MVLRPPVSTTASYAQSTSAQQRRTLLTGYRPMTLADLANRLIRMMEVKVRWKLV